MLSASEAASLIGDRMTVTVSSSSGLACPDRVLRGIGERFEERGVPREITAVHPIAAGDMYGMKGMDHLACSGLLARVVAGSFPSGPSSQLPPLIWQMIEADEVEAYNLPSGVLFQMHRAGAVGQPGVFTEVGLDTFVDPRHSGGRMNAKTVEELVEVRQLGQREWLFFPAIIPDVAIIRATTADELGNLTFEDEGSPLGALDQAYATHNNGGTVIAQVKRVAAAGSLHPQQVRVPGITVDAIVVDPDQWQTTQTPYDPAISGQLRRPSREFERAEWSVEKVIARRAAMDLHQRDIVNLGFGIAALVPLVLVEEGLSGEVTWVIEQGAVGGVPLTGFAFGCSLNPEAILPSIDQFTLLQGGGFNRAVLSFLEVDQQGNVNAHSLPGRRHVTAGVGGFMDITSRGRELTFAGRFTAGQSDMVANGGALTIRRDGATPKFVPEVSSITFSGRRALERGQRVRYVTERCVLELRVEGLIVTELAPGVNLDAEVLGRLAFPLQVAPDLRPMDPRLFRPEPMRLRLKSGNTRATGQ